MVEPRVLIEVLDFVCDSLTYSVIAIEPSYERPVKFAGTEYVRIGENKKKLAEFPEHERALWIATGRRRFETAVASSNVTANDVFATLDPDPIYDLTGEPKPTSQSAIANRNDNTEVRLTFGGNAKV